MTTDLHASVVPASQPYPVYSALDAIQSLLDEGALVEQDDSLTIAGNAHSLLLQALAPLGFVEVLAGTSRLCATHPEAPAVLKVAVGEWVSDALDREDVVFSRLNAAAPEARLSHAPVTWWLTEQVCLQERLATDLFRATEALPRIASELAALGIEVEDLSPENIGWRQATSHTALDSGMQTPVWVLLDGGNGHVRSTELG